MKQIKKILSTLFVSASLLSFSQVTLGAKGNVISQTGDPTWENIKNGTVDAKEE